MKKSVVLLLILVMVFGIVGCKKPKLEKYEEIQNHETAFVIPLEGDMSNQGKMKSYEALQKYQVAIKRINIPLRWKKTGRMYFSGDWIDTVKIIRVDRSPVTREWIKDENKGSNKKDDAIWIESEDSVTFSTGFTVTGQIMEEDSALFLYSYPNKALSMILDTEVRGRIQSKSAEIAAQYPMDALREKKMEIIKAAREDCIPYFKAKGIRITTLGMFGGFNYENAGIQTAIDEVFIAQQEKEVSKAALEAQDDKNSRIKLEATALANAAIERAIGTSEAIKIEAEAEARAIELVALAAANANSNPVFVTLKELEIEAARINKWNGQYPMHYWSTSSNDGLGIIVNTPK